MIADSVPDPSEPESPAPDPQQPPGNEKNDPIDPPTDGDNQEEVVPRKGSSLPFFSAPDIPDTHRQPPEINPSNGKSGQLDWLFDLILPKSW